MPDNDELSGIFDHLSPEDFKDPDLSAQHIVLPDECSFDQFIASQMDLLRYAFAACDGAIHPMTVLATANHAIVYQADDDETLGQYISRMSTEARRLNARWAFFYKRTLIASTEKSASHDVADMDLMAAAANEGTAWEAVYWYAARTDGEPTMRHGYISIDGARLTNVAEAPEQHNGLLQSILEPQK